MKEKTITISVTEDELRVWKAFKQLRDECLMGIRFPRFERTLLKRIEKELEKLE